MHDSYNKPLTVITFGLPPSDLDFLAELQEFIDREAERRQRIVPDWLSIRIDGIHQCVIDSESWCRLEFAGGTSKVEIVGRDAEGEVVIATYLPTYDGPKTEAWKVSLPSGDEVSCTFEYDDEQCVRVEAKRIVKPKLGEKHAPPANAAQEKLVGFASGYVEGLRIGDPPAKHHFLAHFEKLLNLRLRAGAVPSDRVQDLPQETLSRVAVDRAYLRVVLDRARDKFRSLFASLTSRSRPLTLFDPSPGRCEPDPRLTGPRQMPPLDVAPLRVFLLAESAPLRQSLSGVFRRAGISVAGQCGHCDLTAKEIAATRCDVLLVNLATAVNNKAKTMELLREILDCTPRMRVIVLGMMEDPGCFLDAVLSGALGFLLKDASATEIISAVRSIVRGGIVCPPRLRPALLRHFSQGRFQASNLSHRKLTLETSGITDRQRELFGSCGPTVDK